MTTETFGPEHRPIVEFALDNVQTLKLRKAKQQSWQQQAPHDDNNSEENDKPSKAGVHSHAIKDRKRKSQEHDNPAKDSVQNTNGELGGKVANGKSPQGHKSKRQKGNNNKTTSSEVSSLKDNPKALSMKSKNNQDGQNPSGTLLEAQNTAIDTNRKKSGNKDDVGYRKRKMQNQEEQGGEKVSRRRQKKKKEPAGKEVVDKLDMLIEQYRSKFSHKGSKGNDGEKQDSKQLRRWFQS